MLPCWVVGLADAAGTAAGACWSRSARRRDSSRASCRRTLLAWAERNALDRSSSVQVAMPPPSISPVAGSVVTRRSDAFFLAGARAASSAAWAMALACWTCAAAPESTAMAAAADREPAAGSRPMASDGRSSPTAASMRAASSCGAGVMPCSRSRASSMTGSCWTASCRMNSSRTLARPAGTSPSAWFSLSCWNRSGLNAWCSESAAAFRSSGDRDSS
ncbi:MAG: hypothetical protein GAK34_03473 [Delftia tsuruhatensis]|nr:MAG: hypothetical protein GAK34_03473 [Delftia tsuruhatensis]